jgi:hypothetical protein
MILVIMGAGASYDSIHSKPPSRSFDNRPPLANNLFDEQYLIKGRIQEFGRCAAIIPDLQNTADGKSLEQKLQKYQEQADSNPERYRERYRQLAGLRFFLQNMIFNIDQPWYDSGLHISNHLTLIDHIWGVVQDNLCFVTFNYDRLIEFALEKHGRRFFEIDSYISSKNLSLFKLHGSVNWKRKAVSWPSEISVLLDVIENAQGLQFGDEFAIVDNPLQLKISDRICYPAISIPVVTKSKFECPRAHLQTLEQLLPETKLIIIVGWRGAEQHFIEILINHIHKGIPTMVIAGNENDASITLRNLRSSGLDLPFSPSDKGFTGAILSGEIIDFVRSQYNPYNNF